MDNVAHTLVGAAIAQSGVGRRTALGGTALVIGANLPDVDALTYFHGFDTALWFRRGWTHGVLALVVLPPALTTMLLVWDRMVSAERVVHGGQLLLLSAIGVWSHPGLDWLNNYGLRWLMPFDDRWFYGDAVFIVDPWIWLALGSPVFLFRSRTVIGRLAWAVGFGLASAPVILASPDVSAKLIWFAALGVLIFLRMKSIGLDEISSRRAAGLALAVTVVYIVAMLGSTQWARAKTAELLEARGVQVEDLMVAPRPVTPFSRNVLVATKEAYRFGALSFLPSLRLEMSEQLIPMSQRSDAFTKAWTSPELRGFTTWARYPFAEILEDDTGYAVYLADARYARNRRTGLGASIVRIPKE